MQHEAIDCFRKAYCSQYAFESIFITSKDVNDVESAMNVEYLDYRRLKHARTFAQLRSRASVEAFAIARVLREHAAAAGQDEWMYALARDKSDRTVEVRNLMFQQLDRRDVDEVRQLLAAHPDVPSADIQQHLSALMAADAM